MELGAAIDHFCLQQVPVVSRSKRWLLLQTVYTGVARRAALEKLPLLTGRPIADLGCGFGAMAFELADRFKAPVIGIDTDAECLAIANQLAGKLAPLPVRFIQQDVTRLDATAIGTFQALFARFLLQHLPQPDSALARWTTLLESGGCLIVEDVDDGWMVQYPPAPPQWQRLVQAFRQLQHDRGGNREIGRRLTHYLLEQGLILQQIAFTPWATSQEEQADDAAVQFEYDRVHNEYHALVGGGYVTCEQFREGETAFWNTFPRRTFVSNATLTVVAQKP